MPDTHPKLNPIQIQKYLKGADYPSTKDRLVQLARTNHAPDDILSQLAKLPDSDFNKPTDVIKALTLPR